LLDGSKEDRRAGVVQGKRVSGHLFKKRRWGKDQSVNRKKPEPIQKPLSNKVNGTSDGNVRMTGEERGGVELPKRRQRKTGSREGEKSCGA